MTTKRVQKGDTVTYSNAGSAIASGDVVKMNNIVGVALADIAATTGTGPVAVEGCFTVPKVTGVAWTIGQALVWDVSVSKFDTPANCTEATGDVTGAAVVFAAAGSSDATGVVKLTPNGATTIT